MGRCLCAVFIQDVHQVLTESSTVTSGLQLKALQGLDCSRTSSWGNPDDRGDKNRDTGRIWNLWQLQIQQTLNIASSEHRNSHARPICFSSCYLICMSNHQQKNDKKSKDQNTVWRDTASISWLREGTNFRILLDSSFTTINIVRALVAKEDRLQEQVGNVSREMKTLTATQGGILEVKRTNGREEHQSWVLGRSHSWGNEQCKRHRLSEWIQTKTRWYDLHKGLTLKTWAKSKEMEKDTQHQHQQEDKGYFRGNKRESHDDNEMGSPRRWCVPWTTECQKILRKSQ